MRFSAFIKDNLGAIVDEWEAFARTLRPSANDMSVPALRNHAREMLLAIAADMETSQTRKERSDKSKCMELETGMPESAASAHGALRQLAGFDLVQLFGEFRAMRASVLAMWRRSDPTIDGPGAIEEIARFNEGIDQALAESVDRYSTDIATFLAVIGHDLRSPLWAIQGTSELLAAQNVSDATRQEAMRRITRSAKVMGRLIGDLLEYTGTQLGRGIPVQRSLCDMGAVCEEALEVMQAAYPQQEFVHRRSGDLQFQADGTRLQQVLANLLNNAVHHGGQLTPITMTVDGEADEIVVTVTNAGKPIPPAALHSIFEPLLQVPVDKSQPHKAPYTGLGMGLFIVREIVQRHQGSVEVKSTEATGTVFTVRLPRAGY